MKRFWDSVAAARQGEGPNGATWQVLLDGKPVRVPGGAPLRLHQKVLAEAIAEEWRQAGSARGGDMSEADLPLTRLAGTAQERIAPDPEPVVLELARYAESDLLCYRAEVPAALAEREHAQWQPWLDWAEAQYGAHLRVTSGVTHVPQDPRALAALAQALAAMDAAALAALGIAIPALGSLVLGLALAAGRIDAAQAHALATLDERFQAEFWGEDEEAAARQRHIAAEIEVAARFMELSRS